MLISLPNKEQFIAQCNVEFTTPTAPVSYNKWQPSPITLGDGETFKVYSFQDGEITPVCSPIEYLVLTSLIGAANVAYGCTLMPLVDQARIDPLHLAQNGSTPFDLDRQLSLIQDLRLCDLVHVSRMYSQCQFEFRKISGFVRAQKEFQIMSHWFYWNRTGAQVEKIDVAMSSVKSRFTDSLKLMKTRGYKLPFEKECMTLLKAMQSSRALMLANL